MPELILGPAHLHREPASCRTEIRRLKVINISRAGDKKFSKQNKTEGSNNGWPPFLPGLHLPKKEPPDLGTSLCRPGLPPVSTSHTSGVSWLHFYGLPPAEAEDTPVLNKGTYISTNSLQLGSLEHSFHPWPADLGETQAGHEG